MHVKRTGKRKSCTHTHTHTETLLFSPSDAGNISVTRSRSRLFSQTLLSSACLLALRLSRASFRMFRARGEAPAGRRGSGVDPLSSKERVRVRKKTGSEEAFSLHVFVAFFWDPP